MNTQTVHKSDKPARRWDIDWLRVLAVLLLFYYHPARIFYIWGGWYIEDAPKSKGLSYIALFIEQWHMPLFFLLAGVSTWFALRKRSGGQYLMERFKRLWDTPASLVVTVALYDLLVKRFNLIRFLFGMRPKRVEAPAKRRRAAVA